MSHAFETLNPDLVLDALDSVGLHGDGRLMALSSYENRVYQVQLEDGSAVIAKFYRPQRWSTEAILEEHRFAQELAEYEVPAVAPLLLHGQSLHHFGDFAFSVSPRRGGRTPELDDPEVLEWIGRLLARLHTVGVRQDFSHRAALNVDTFALEPMQWLLAHDMVPLDVQSAWTRTVHAAIAAISEHPALLAHTGGGHSTQGIRLLRLHGDCHPNNILWTPPAAQSSQPQAVQERVQEQATSLPLPDAATPASTATAAGPHFVDLDDARMGPAVQDLWMLISGDRAQRTRQLASLVDGYEQLREFNRAELALIEPLRTLRLIHYSAWLARRWDDPIFAVNFPWFGSSDYWQGQVQMLEEQLEAMQEAPLVV